MLSTSIKQENPAIKNLTHSKKTNKRRRRSNTRQRAEFYPNLLTDHLNYKQLALLEDKATVKNID